MYIVVDINPQQPLLEAADPPRLAKVMLHIAFGMKVQDLWGCHSSCFQHSSFQLGCLKISQDQFVNSQHLGTHAKDVPQRPLRVFDTLDNSDLPSGPLPHPTCWWFRMQGFWPSGPKDHQQWAATQVLAGATPASGPMGRSVDGAVSIYVRISCKNPI